jgi:hypothetical protein
LVVVALAAPASAEVLITCEMPLEGQPNVSIGYVNTEGQPVRSFALDISVDSGTITDVNCFSADYYLSYIYPVGIQINDEGEVTDWSSSDVNGADAGIVTVELTSLYDPNDPNHNQPPPDEDDLLIITVDEECCMSIAANELLGGVVMEDGNSVEPNSPGCCVELGCLKVGEVHGGWLITQQMYDNWVLVGKPVTWCHSCHSRGDVNMDCFVANADVIGPGLPNLAVSYPSAWPAANYHPDCDFNNDLQVNAADLIGQFPGDPNCLATNYPSTCPTDNTNMPETMNCP